MVIKTENMTYWWAEGFTESEVCIYVQVHGLFPVASAARIGSVIRVCNTQPVSWRQSRHAVSRRRGSLQVHISHLQCVSDTFKFIDM